MEVVLHGPNGSTQLGPYPLTIGRSPENQLVVNHSKASSHHAEIRPAGQGHTITDLGSTNGTFVNGQPLEHNVPRMLMSGDTIRISDASYTYEVRNPQPPAPPMYGNQNQSGNYSGTQFAPQQSYQSTAYGGNQGSQGYHPTQQAGYQPPQQPGYQPTQQAGYQGYNQNQQQGFPLPPPPAPPYNPIQSASYTPTPPPYNQQQQQPYNLGQQYNPAPVPYPGPAGSYVPPPPTVAASRRGGGLRTILLVGLALIVIIGAASTFFIIHNNQVAADHAKGTVTAQTATARSTTITQNTAIANATATAVANPYGSGSGTLALVDEMKDNSGNHQWLEDQNCSFANQIYQVNLPTTITFRECFANGTNFTDFTYEVNMTILNGDCGGMSFRGDSASDKAYIYAVCGDGSYALYLYDGSKAKTVVNASSSSAIKTSNQINKLAVVVNGSSIQLYVNNTSLQTVQDSTYTSGNIGVIAIDNQNVTKVQYTAARVWQ